MSLTILLFLLAVLPGPATHAPIQDVSRCAISAGLVATLVGFVVFIVWLILTRLGRPAPPQGRP